jgi:hypothetical protein
MSNDKSKTSTPTPPVRENRIPTYDDARDYQRAPMSDRRFNDITLSQPAPPAPPVPPRENNAK